MSSKKLIKEIQHFFNYLFPIERSLTGKGNRQTLEFVRNLVPLNILEIPSGKKVYDWEVPNEWHVKEAWVKNSDGKKILDFKKNNLHLLGYSIPIKQKLSFSHLKNRLHYIEDKPDTIPYRTSYYQNDWGFCLTKNQFISMEKDGGPFEVLIDSEFDRNGSLSIGEFLIPGKSKKEILISTYICHPSLANDNLSGIVLTAFLAKFLLEKRERRYTYRIVWLPETIGAISYCHLKEKELQEIDMGLVVTTVAGPGPIGFKKSFEEHHPINKIIRRILQKSNSDFIEYPFDINGSDERQYSAKGFRINTASITKSKYYEYSEYHTSDDNLQFISAENLNETLNLYTEVINKIDDRIIFESVSPYCETMLSKHNLYPTVGGAQKPDIDVKSKLDKVLWVLFKSDGKLSTEDVSDETNIDHSEILKISRFLEKKGLLKEI